MRKEVLLAVIAGALFGLIIAFGIWRANISLSPQGQADDVKMDTSTATPSPIGDLNLVIAKPDQNTVFTETPVEISGITLPNSWVVVSGEENDLVITSSNDGSFSGQISLTGGVNQILITSFDQSGTSTTDELTVIYSSEFNTLPPNSQNE